MNPCRHFKRKGLDVVCAVGVDIKKLCGAPAVGWGCRVPCAPSALSRDMVACAQRSPLTDEEVASDRRAFDAGVERFARGRSPCCDAELIAQANDRFCDACKQHVAHVTPDRNRRCRACGNKSTAECEYELRGRLEGKTCGDFLCARCQVPVDGKRVCQPHARVMQRERRPA